MTNPSKFLKSFIFLSFLALFLFTAEEAKACLFDSDCNECSRCVFFSCQTMVLYPPGVDCPAILWDAGCSGVQRKGRDFICDNHGCVFDGWAYKCDQSCGAECDGDSDCSNYCQSNTEYYNGQCQSSCTCSYSSRSCGNDFCSAVSECTRFDYYCDGDSCGNRYVTDNSCTNKCPSTETNCSTHTNGVCDGDQTTYPCVSGSCTRFDSDYDSACEGLTCDSTNYYCDTRSGGVCDGHKTTYTCNDSGGCIGSDSDNDSECEDLLCNSTGYYCDTHSDGVCDGHKTIYQCNSSGGCIGSDSDDDQECNGASCGTKSNPACPEKTCTRYCDGSGNCGDCTYPACDCTCPGWTTRSCGYSTCSWYKKGYTRTCAPSGCDTEFKCVCKESCCTDWTDQGCGQGSCAEDQMYQTRDCGTCSYLESQCISDSNCGTTGCDLNKTGNYTVDYSCILDGVHYLQSGNLTITTGGYIQMNPDSSITFDSGYEIIIEGSGYILKSASGAEIKKE